MAAGLRIALVKPDWRIRGGFERVLDTVVDDLTEAGHDVRRVEVDVYDIGHRPFGLPIDDDLWAAAPEWFSHLALLDAFRGVDVSFADVVISTQPPSYAVRHPRHLALFYHHARAFYDLEQVWIRAGRAPASVHHTASTLLRRAERADLDSVTLFLAGSPRVVERLHSFGGPATPTTPYEAAAPPVQPQTGRSDHVLCVSRHEFTKRTELVVLAAALTGSAVPVVLIGDGGRLPFVRDLAGRISNGNDDPAVLPDEQTWCNLGLPSAVPAVGVPAGLRIAGRVSDDELRSLYRDALVVVAPAYDEDDGLTVGEAMSYGKPVIVCRDGGGLTNLVEHEVTGLVVEPTGEAIAAAITRLAADRDLARRLGQQGRERIASRTPERARTQLLEAVARVADSPLPS